MHEGLIAHIDNRFQKMIDHLDAVGHAFTEAVGERIGQALDALLGGIGGVSDKIVAKADSFVAGKSSLSAPDTPRSQQISSPEKTPAISQSVIASAKQATMSMNSFQVADVENHNFSPSVTPSMGFGGQSYGMAV